jgi:hypothetical protein
MRSLILRAEHNSLFIYIACLLENKRKKNYVKSYKFHLQINVSSRQALIHYLTDNSTETFWENEEDDKNKTKFIELIMTNANVTCSKITIAVDNTRDVLVRDLTMIMKHSVFNFSLFFKNKVTNISVFAGTSHGEKNLIETLNIEPDNSVWITFPNNSTQKKNQLKLSFTFT